MAEEGTPAPKNKGGEQGVCFASMEKGRIKVEYLCNEPQGVRGSQSLAPEDDPKGQVPDSRPTPCLLSGLGA